MWPMPLQCGSAPALPSGSASSCARSGTGPQRGPRGRCWPGHAAQCRPGGRQAHAARRGGEPGPLQGTLCDTRTKAWRAGTAGRRSSLHYHSRTQRWRPRAEGRASGRAECEDCDLARICNALDASFFALCISNDGRPAAQALLGFVEAAVDAFQCGHALARVLLELSLGSAAEDHEQPSAGPGASSEFRLTSAGYRLTTAEQQYRAQWVTVVYLTLDRLSSRPALPGGRTGGPAGPSSTQATAASASTSAGPEGQLQGEGRGAGPDELEASRGLVAAEGRWGQDAAEWGVGPMLEGMEAGLGVGPSQGWLVSIVERVIVGQATGEEQSAVRFDRALATGGASGGIAADRVVIAPQWVPATQLILLTMKVLNQRHCHTES